MAFDRQNSAYNYGQTSTAGGYDRRYYFNVYVRHNAFTGLQPSTSTGTGKPPPFNPGFGPK